MNAIKLPAFLIVCLLCVTGSTLAADNASRPNIVFIMADDI